MKLKPSNPRPLTFVEALESHRIDSADMDQADTWLNLQFWCGQVGPEYQDVALAHLEECGLKQKEKVMDTPTSSADNVKAALKAYSSLNLSERIAFKIALDMLAEQGEPTPKKPRAKRGSRKALGKGVAELASAVEAAAGAK